MAESVLFILMLVSIIHMVFGRNCLNETSLTNCDDCFRCGGSWCTESRQCNLRPTDDWCQRGREKKIEIKNYLRDDLGSVINPVYSEKFADVGLQTGTELTYKAAKHLNPTYNIVNTSQNYEVKLTTFSNKCSSEGMCTIIVDALPTTEFCSSRSETIEHVDVKMTLDTIKDDIMLKYYIPCACNCSSYIERNSDKCNGRGDYRCGVCSCNDGWNGTYCDQIVCNNRGDVPCNSLYSDEECSGNGVCQCGSCRCSTEKEGSQYYDDTCTDICTITRTCDSCLRHRSCEDCPLYIDFVAHNRTTLEERDSLGRKTWISCNVTVDDCVVRYAARKEHYQNIVMIIDSCDPEAAAVGGGINVTVPAILGILAFAVVASAVAGYVYMKSRAPPLPLTDPQYQNIDADFSQGENPLYKSPTSSFKNPTYGKW